MSRAARRSISRAVAESATRSVATGATSSATRAGAQAAAREAAKTTLRSASPAARAAALRAAGSAGARAATGGTAKALARAAGRFAPGVNVAVAAYDTAVAVKDLADPKASWIKKAASVATAAGSGVAATNIPILSQVGAGLSVLTGLVRDFSK